MIACNHPSWVIRVIRVIRVDLLETERLQQPVVQAQQLRGIPLRSLRRARRDLHMRLPLVSLLAARIRGG